MILKLKDLEYPIDFNINALTKAQEDSGIDPLSSNVQDLRFIHSLAYYGLVEGAKIEGKDFDFDKESIGRLIGVTEVLEIMKLFRSTMPGSKEEDTEKK